MADPILKRTVLCTQKNGIVRFLNWAIVTAEVAGNLETMVEPFQPGQRIGIVEDIGNFDPEDPMARIDEIRMVDDNGYRKLLSGGDEVIALHGGNHSMRIGP